MQNNICNLGLFRNKNIKIDNEFIDVCKYINPNNIDIKKLFIDSGNLLIPSDIGKINVYDFLNLPSFNDVYALQNGHFIEDNWYYGIQKIINLQNDKKIIVPSGLNNATRNEFCFDNNCSKQNLNNLIEFAKYINIPFLYIQAPDKISPNDTNLPVDNNANENVDIFLQHLCKNNINFLDIRKFMLLNNISFADNFFKSDIHWKPELAFLSTEQILKNISSITGINFNFEYNNPQNFHFDIYKDIYLGNLGKITGMLYTGLDDFTVIHPKFDTHFTFSCDSINFHSQGNAYTSLLNTKRLSDGYFEKSVYATYNLVDRGYVIIKNKNAYNNKKMLMIQDSFANPVASFISHHFSECHFVDLRGDISNHQLLDIIKKVNPDIVCMMYYPYHVSKHTKTFNVNPLI